MEVEIIDIAKLVFDPDNARKHSNKNLDAIKGSLTKFGQQKPIVIDDKNIVLAGNGTLAAAKDLGWKTIAVVRSNLKGNDKVGFSLADNRTAELAEWDDDALNKHLAALDLSGFDIESIGFDLNDIDQTKEGHTDDDAIPEVEQNEFGVQLGDIWQLGEHRLMCGDSTDKAQVEKLMNGEKADMVFTDPPYGIEYDDKIKTKWTRQSATAKQNNFGQIQNDHVPVEKFVSAILGYFDYCGRVFIWGVLNGNGNVPKGSFIVWDRKTEAMADCPFGDFDICWSKNVGWKMIRILWGGYLSKERGEKRHHPTQKPAALAQEFFDRWGKPNDLVVDLFLGSGSTLIACEKTNRKCYGMEIDPHYCSVIIKRWQDYTGKKAVKVSDG